MLTSEISKKTSTLTWDRKVSVPISMPQSLLVDIDGLRGDVPRSVFVCKILRKDIQLKGETGGEGQVYAAVG
jgi:hypothetical protein